MPATRQIPLDALRKCWFLAGPTAVGKTALSLALAEKLNAEIIALDSMTLYRGMDIGTAKATPAERASIRHHLLDLLDPWEEFSVARYLDAAAQSVADILARNKTPLFVGGTGLYLRSLLRGVFEGPSADPRLRAELEQVLATHGGEELHRRLAQLDPVTAARLHPNDHRRLIRALEVIQLTGQPFSDQQQQPPLSLAERPPHVYWLSPPRDWLRHRINQRVDQMFDQGLLDEVHRLQAHPRGLSPTARQALGYKELLDAFDSDQNLVTARDLIQTRTRQFAKRQCTWFRNLPECTPININGTESTSDLLSLIQNQATLAEMVTSELTRETAPSFFLNEVAFQEAHANGKHAVFVAYLYSGNSKLAFQALCRTWQRNLSHSIPVLILNAESPNAQQYLAVSDDRHGNGVLLLYQGNNLVSSIPGFPQDNLVTTLENFLRT